MFPHHENELAQSESATGKPFAKYWLHNGLTRINTKKISGRRRPSRRCGRWQLSWRIKADREARPGAAALPAAQHALPPPDRVHRRSAESPRKKGLSVFTRLFERDRAARRAKLTDASAEHGSGISTSCFASEHAPFVRDVLAFKMKFLEMMDDDFNTAGAIGVMHETGRRDQRFIEKNKVEYEKHPDTIAVVAAAAQTLRKIGQLLGMFSSAPSSKPCPTPPCWPID